MKRLLLIGLVCSALLLVALAVLAQDGGEIRYGDRVFATFTGPEQAHVYTFTGGTGDKVYIRAEVQDVTAVLEGQVGLSLDATLTAPDGSSVSVDKRQDTFGHVLLDGTLLADGTYTLTIINVTKTGEYKLALDAHRADAIIVEGDSDAQPADDPPDIPAEVNIPQTPLMPGTILAYGEGGTGTIAAVEERDMYTFTGSEGDIVRITMMHIEGYSTDVGFDPLLRLLAPDGTELIKRNTQPNEFLDAQIIYQLPANGTYTIVAQDFLALGRGKYGLLLDTGTQVMLDAIPATMPDDGVLALDGEPVVGEITDYGMPLEATFQGAAGQDVRIAMDEFDYSGIDPLLILLTPDGSELARDDDSGGGLKNNNAVIVANLPVDGTYTIVMTTGITSTDYLTGPIGLFILTVEQSTSATSGAEFVVEGLSASEQQAFPLDGAAGRVVVIQVEPQTDVMPQVGVYTQDEQLIAETVGNKTSYTFTVMLPDDDLYLLRVSARYGTSDDRVAVRIVYQGDDLVEAGVPAIDEAAITAALAEAEAQIEAQQPPECTATVASGANLRGGPGTTYAVVAGAAAGDMLRVTGQNAAGDWYQLQIPGIETAWIASFLVSEPACPADFTLPVVE
jgi:hypothetical protein